MWTLPIVLDGPFFYLAARIVERNENVLVKAFLAQPRIEALDVRVLDRLARFDELQPHAMIIGPLVEHPAAQFGTIIRLNHARQTPVWTWEMGNRTCEEIGNTFWFRSQLG